MYYLLQSKLKSLLNIVLSLIDLGILNELSLVLVD